MNFESEKSTGLILIACTIFSLFMANSIFGAQYINTWHMKLGGESLEYWINDGLMTIFFY
jgi:NhaA family Na+:H+ antiporter